MRHAAQRLLLPFALAAPLIASAAPSPARKAGGSPSAAIQRLASWRVPAGWTVSEDSSTTDPGIRFQKDVDEIRVRLLGGKGSRYASPQAFMDGFEAKTMGAPPEDFGGIVVARIKTRRYRVGYPVNLGDPHVHDPRPPQLARMEFCIIPNGELFFVLSWAHDSPVPDPDFAGDKAWRSFLRSFRLLRKGRR